MAVTLPLHGQSVVRDIDLRVAAHRYIIMSSPRVKRQKPVSSKFRTMTVALICSKLFYLQTKMPASRYSVLQ